MMTETEIGDWRAHDGSARRIFQNDGPPRNGIASLADCREHLHGELRMQRNLDHEGSSALVAPLRGWRLGHCQTHFPPVNARTSQQAERCHHVHNGSRERRQTAIPRRRNRERKRVPEPIGLPETDALRTLPKHQLAPPDQRQVQHCGRLVQQSRIDHDGCHIERRGVQEGHTGTPRERLPLSLCCYSPRSRKNRKQQALSPTSPRRWQEKISTVVMPFVDDVTQPLQRVLHVKPLNICVVGKPATWKWCLQHLLKDSSNLDEEPSVVYRLTCNDCDQTYIGKTGRTAITRAKEHASYVRNGGFDMSAAADHAIIHQHSLSFKTVQIVGPEPRAAGGEWKRRCTSAQKRTQWTKTRD